MPGHRNAIDDLKVSLITLIAGSHLIGLLEQFVERGMFGSHLGPFDSLDDHLGGIDRS